MLHHNIYRYRSLLNINNIKHASTSSITSNRHSTNNNNDLQLHCFPSFNLMFIGTGASPPTKLRGSPSTILHLGSENFLFDAGEGTMRQALFGRNLKRTSRIFITHMNGDHIMGLPSVVLNNHIKKTDDDENDDHDENIDEELEEVNRPLMIYGPQGLHEYLCTFMRLTDTNLTQEVIVHEMMISEDDVKRTFHNKPIPWYKPLNKFQHSPLDQRKHTPFIRRVEIRSDSEGLWPLVDDPRIKIKAGLISHRTPSFGFVVKETDQVGSLDSNKCKDLGMKNHSSHGLLFKDLKSGKDVKLENDMVIRAKDVLGPSISGRKIVILGDTSDASVLSSAAKDCDILVHEATYSNQYEQVSKLKGHSTPNMAALTAIQFNAKRLILNHIGNIYLPHFIDSKNNEHVVLSKATDKMLYEEATKALNRPQHVIVSRDFTVAKIPVGGYKMENDEFYYINTAVAVPYNNASKSHLDYFVSPSMKPVLKPIYNNKYKTRNNSHQNNSYQNSNNKSKNINNSIQK